MHADGRQRVADGKSGLKALRDAHLGGGAYPTGTDRGRSAPSLTSFGRIMSYCTALGSLVELVHAACTMQRSPGARAAPASRSRPRPVPPVHAAAACARAHPVSMHTQGHNELAISVSGTGSVDLCASPAFAFFFNKNTSSSNLLGSLLLL